MFSSVCIVILLTLPPARADFWDDFSNNLATDLAPLLSLFGEKVTMQYLSESITFLDYFILAMAPMGILTALVSAIRVCGSPSLRAFVGRAQEGAGNAEAELCSSTSRNVCELYNNGGIARVFGRPKILEVMHDPSVPDFSKTAGIYTFQDYIKTKNGKASWKEVGARTDMESQNEDIDSGPFAPNLSLNVGIKRKPDAIFWGVAIFGAFLQFGVLVYAGIITYYLQWVSENSSSVQYACPLTIIGTLLVCSGVFYCAYLVGESTSEKIYCRSSSTDKSTSQEGTKKPVPALYWLQPGGQVLGDQIFDAFCYSDCDQPLQKYLVSWKRRSKEKKRRIWEAVCMTTIGFLMQFIGLRGIHPTASIAQLGAIIVMSAARASLRMQRLKPRDNSLVDCPDEVVGYELDWLALYIGREDIQSELGLTRHEPSSNPSEERREFWEFRGTSKHFYTRHDKRPVRSSEDHNAAAKLLAYRRRLAELTDSTSLGSTQATSTRHFRDDMIKVKSVAKQLVQALESAASVISTDTPGFTLGARDSLWWEVDCSVATRVKSKKHQNDPSSQKTFPVQIPLYQAYESCWKLDSPFEIEAILGLWIWSLVSDFPTETQDRYEHVRISRALEVPIHRIISTSKDRQHFDLWLDNFTWTCVWEFYCKDAQVARSADIFTLKESYSGLYEPLVGDLPQDLVPNIISPRVIRYFGWDNIETNQKQEVCIDSDKTLALITIKAESLVSCCAQEIFGSFIKSLLSHVPSVGRISVEKRPRGFIPSSTLLNDLIETFVNSGLGSQEDAVSCILPAMLPKLRSAPIETAFQVAMATLKKHRESKRQESNPRETNHRTSGHWRSEDANVAIQKLLKRETRQHGYWKRAEDLLHWAWRICKQPPGEDEVRLKDYARLCAMALGELYILGFTDGLESFRIHWGVIKWLQDEGKDQSEGCRKTIECYSTVLKELCTTNNERQSPSVGNNSDLVSSLLSLSWPSNGLARAQKGPDLYEVAGLGWAEVVLASLTCGADPDLADQGARCQTPLFNAAKHGKANVVDILIEWGASQYLRSSEGLLPLDSAVLNRHHTIVKSLLDTFDPTLVSECRGTNIQGKTTLHIAAEQEDEDMIKLLIDSGKFDLESRDDDGNTPLHIAADRLAEAPVESLVDRDAPGNKVGNEIGNDGSYIPLDLAIHQGQVATVKMFFDVYKVDPNGRGPRRSTPLHKAVRCRQESVVKLLLDTYNVDREREDNKGLTPLHWATKSPDGQIARLLVDTYKFNTDVRDYSQMTPLEHAVLERNLDIVEVMANFSSEETRTRALLLAKKKGYDRVIDLLARKAE